MQWFVLILKICECESPKSNQQNKFSVTVNGVMIIYEGMWVRVFLHEHETKVLHNYRKMHKPKYQKKPINYQNFVILQLKLKSKRSWFIDYIQDTDAFNKILYKGAVP